MNRAESRYLSGKTETFDVESHGVSNGCLVWLLTDPASEDCASPLLQLKNGKPKGGKNN